MRWRLLLVVLVAACFKAKPPPKKVEPPPPPDPAQEVRELVKTIYSTLETGDPDPVKPLETLSDLPVIKAFVVRYPSASAQSIQDFYDDYYAKKRVFDTKMELAKQGDLDAFDRVQNIDPSAWDEMAGIRDTLTQQSQLVRLIYKNPDFSPEDKRQLIDSIYYRMIELAKVGNDAMRELAEILGEP